MMITKVKTVMVSALLAVLLASVAIAGSGQISAPAGGEEGLSAQAAERVVVQRAQEILQMIKKRDFSALADTVHPIAGVRFSAYSYVDASENGDLVFWPEQVEAFGADEREYTWGYYDGSGLRIELTPQEYFDTFVYTADFLRAETVTYNETVGTGNTFENQFEVYPEAAILEYYFSGFNPEYMGMDWESLRLAFEQLDGVWYLVGVVHDQWTI